VPDWYPYTAARRATMIVDTECKLVDDPYRIEREFWQGRDVAPAA
jgi:para-nitrobenzyl esterase